MHIERFYDQTLQMIDRGETISALISSTSAACRSNHAAAFEFSASR